jgi:hypothetical protein
MVDFIPIVLIEDRFAGYLNGRIDEHGTQLMQGVKSTLEYVSQ